MAYILISWCFHAFVICWGENLFVDAVGVVGKGGGGYWLLRHGFTMQRFTVVEVFLTFLHLPSDRCELCLSICVRKLKLRYVASWNIMSNFSCVVLWYRMCHKFRR